MSELIEEAGVERGRVLAAGMGLPGPIDRESGLVHSQPILPGWVGLDPAAEMEERLGLPVHLDNDANVGALGESTFGVGRGSLVMAYLRLSAGIGAGLVISGRPFRGARGIAGEIGHVLVDPQGPICRCGNRGCLETFVAGPALCELLEARTARMTVRRLPSTRLRGRPRRPARGDRRRTRRRSRARRRLQRPQPRLVVVGGDVPAGDVLLAGIRDAVRRFRSGPRPPPEFVAVLLGDRAELLGALVVAGHGADGPLTVPGPRLAPSLQGGGRGEAMTRSRRALVSPALFALSFGVAGCGWRR